MKKFKVDNVVLRVSDLTVPVGTRLQGGLLLTNLNKRYAGCFMICFYNPLPSGEIHITIGARKGYMEVNRHVFTIPMYLTREKEVAIV